MSVSVSLPYRTPEKNILWRRDDIVIAVEKVFQVRFECQEITRQHWDEIAGYKDEVPLDPDWEEYIRLERAGHLVMVVVREAGEIIGYAVWITTGHLHYRSIYQAINDLVYIRKDKRRGSLGNQLLNLSEKYLASRGCNKAVIHMKPWMDFAALLKRRGYLHEEMIFGKLLKEDA